MAADGLVTGVPKEGLGAPGPSHDDAIAGKRVQSLLRDVDECLGGPCVHGGPTW